MGIKSGIGTGVIPILDTDTTVLLTSDRVVVTACNCHNTTGGTLNISVHISADEISANGEEVATLSIAAGENQDIGAIIGEGQTDNIIMVADFVGVNCTTTYTQFSGDSV